MIGGCLKTVVNTLSSFFSGEGRAGGGVHLEHVAQEDPGVEEGEGELGAQLRTGGGMPHQRPLQKT